MLELEVRLRANGKQCLEAVPKAQILDHSYGMFSRTTWSTTLSKAASKCAQMTITDGNGTLTDEGREISNWYQLNLLEINVIVTSFNR